MKRGAFLAAMALVPCAQSVTASRSLEERRLMLMLRVLGRDRHLKRRAADTLHTAVVFLERDEASKAEARGVFSGLKAAAKVTKVQGLSVVAHAFAFDAQLDKKLQASGVAGAFVCTGLSAEASELALVTARQSCLSFSSDERSIRSGLSVGLLPAASKARLLINLPQSRREGANLPSNLLRLAEVIQ